MKYDFKKIESKWQRKWEDSKIFSVKENTRKKKFYVAEMYPYPSGEGLHIGHAFNQVIGDIYSRFKKMQGFNVLHPMGYDSFGLPAENAAIKAKSHPKKFTDAAINNFMKQQKSLGLSYDWERMLYSHDPEYYRWNQWIFLKMFEKGLAYRKKAPVNWCEKCNTVLANEQVQGGKCWRHEDTDAQIRHLEQWFLKITDYADEIYENTRDLDWPERIKLMQENWIGKSSGTEVFFEVNNKKWSVFTTRPDTLFGVTFLVASAQHPSLDDFVTDDQRKDVNKLLKKIKTTRQEDLDKLEKEGVFSGSYAIHPLTGDRIPVWIGNFVLAEYGSGIVMAVPAHDQRDFEFAQKYDLPMKAVIRPNSEDVQGVTMKEAYSGSGKLINSEEFDDLFSEEAKEHITRALEDKKLGRKAVNYKLRDWLISRQRFWGTPIPVIYCESCGEVPVPEKDLPVVLPENIKFTSGKNPLVDYKPFTEVKCPSCGGNGRRETDTMDTFFDSSWYFLRYADNKNSKRIFDSKKADYWMPMDFYTGGAEHACLHLIYARFFTKFFRDEGLVKIDEPFKKLFNQGMVHAEDGRKMSKSLGNVVDPLDVARDYGADTLRIFLVSSASPDSDSSWNSTGIERMHKFVSKIFGYLSDIKPSKSSPKVESKVNKAIKEITSDVESLKYNLAIIKLRELFDYLNGKGIGKNDVVSCLKLISPFCPHLSEELWEKFGGKGMISSSDWPKADEKKISKKFDDEDGAVEKLISDVNGVHELIKSRNGKNCSKVFAYVLPQDKKLFLEDSEEISRRTGLSFEVYAVNDSEKHDPANASKKAKPLRPGIYLE